MDRRNFLANTATLIAGIALLPACGGTATGGSDAPSAGTPGGSTGGFTNTAWEDLAGTLEAEGVFTATDPGPWAGKEASHVPMAVVNGSSVTVSNTHGMDADHWITTVYARNQDGVVIGLIELDGTEPAAEGTFDLPAGTTSVTPYAHCNQHGLWEGDPVSVA